MFDTAALYGFGANEELLGAVLKPHRADIVLASKCGMFRNEAGVRTIDARPETLRRTCDDSLTRLKTDVIDLYYLHRRTRTCRSRTASARWRAWCSRGRSGRSACRRCPPRRCARRMPCTR